MALAFSRSLRSLDAEGARAVRWVAAGAAALLAVWAAWMFLARVTLVVASTQARTVVDRAVHPVASPAAGRVAEVAVVLGQPIAAGDVIVRLDTSLEVAERARAAARGEALRREHAEAMAQLDAAGAAAASAAERDAAAVDEEAAKRAELILVQTHMQGERDRLEPLRGQGILSEARIAEAQAAVEMAGAVLATYERTCVRQAREREQAAADRRTAIAELRQRVARLAGECAEVELETARIDAEIERRTVRAPVRGEIAALGPRAAGAWVAAGAELATVVARGALTVEAAFPAAAIGRLRADVPGRLRLDGFPAARFGTVPVTVARVGTEVEQGAVRVELALAEPRATAVPLQHGLVGTVEVDLERVTPWQLLLHNIGLSRREAAR